MSAGRPQRTRRMAVFTAACAVATVACAMSPDRLPDLDRRFYYNLSSPEDQRQFLRLKEPERQPFLEQRGLWVQWTKLPAEERKAVSTGAMKIGFHEFTVFMAWGPPADTQQGSDGDREVEFHTFIRCSSGPKRGDYVRNNLDCDGTSSETKIAVENDVVTEISYPD